VAPQEYSWQFDATNPQRLVNIDRQSKKATGIITPQALLSLLAASQMDRLYRNESLLQACNRQLINLLANAAQRQKPVDMSPLLTRYAYEVMVAMTTEKRAGFLDETPSTKNITRQLSNWKFHSIINGTFLRYHPFIKFVLKMLHVHSQGQSPLDPVMDVLGNKQPSTDVDDTSEQVGKGEVDRKFPIADREARIALAFAGADPTITLIREVLRTISQDQDLQQHLSKEVRTASLNEQPSFHSLALNKPKVPAVP
jgi:hypothetical protein